MSVEYDIKGDSIIDANDLKCKPLLIKTFILTLFAFLLIHLLKIVQFEKKNVQFAIKLEILLTF